MKKQQEMVVVFSDAHIPFQDDDILSLWLRFAKDQQPDIIVLHELHDFYEVSRYDKDPMRIQHLQDEIDMADAFMASLRKACPKSRIILLNSNHLDRLRKYLWRQAQGLSSLRSLHVEELLQLKKHNIEYMDTFEHKGVLFKHGDMVRKFSSYSAKAEWEKEGVSGSSGHTHRVGVYYTRDRSGTGVWVETGCGCRLHAEYVPGVPNWQNGFGVFIFADGSFVANAVPIIHYMFNWGNTLYSI